jgi:hypothetical protein
VHKPAPLAGRDQGQTPKSAIRLAPICAIRLANMCSKRSAPRQAHAATSARPPSKSHNEQLTTRSRMAWKLLKFRASSGILTTQPRQTSWGKLHKQSALKHLPRPGDGSHCTWQHTVGMNCGYSGGMRGELRPTLVSLPMTRTAAAAATVHRKDARQAATLRANTVRYGLPQVAQLASRSLKQFQQPCSLGSEH